ASTTIYTVTGNSGPCTDTKTVSIQVFPLPVLNPVATPSNICSGAAVTLVSNSASTNTWFPGNIVAATVAVSPTATTIYTVMGTSGAGCVKSETVQLIVRPLPTVVVTPASNTICTGAVSITASGAS